MRKSIKILLILLLVLALTWVLAGAGWYWYDTHVDRGGWAENGGVYYYKDFRGNYVSGWQEIDGSRYYFSPESHAMATYRQELDALAEKVVYTGPIDAYFGYRLGCLQYRSVRFETELLDKPNFQGNAAVNYTDRETPWTRIIEHKWFQFGLDDQGHEIPKTVISREFSSEWKPGDEPYYPVNDAVNGALYAKYRALADGESHVIFGGRLGEYKYYDMDQVIAAALACAQKNL